MRTREDEWKKKLDEIVPVGEAKKTSLAKLEASLGKIDKWFKASDTLWLTGNSISFADIVVVPYMAWIKRTTPEWEEIKTWQDGRWAGQIDRLNPYSNVD